MYIYAYIYMHICLYMPIYTVANLPIKTKYIIPYIYMYT